MCELYCPPGFIQERIRGCVYFRVVDRYTPPPEGTEVFVGKVPSNCNGLELYNHFSTVGRIYEMRMMVNIDGSNRPFAFVAYYDLCAAEDAVIQLNGKPLQHRGYKLVVNKSTDQRNLILTGTRHSITEQRIIYLLEHDPRTSGELNDVRTRFLSNLSKFFILRFKSHKGAAIAKRTFSDSEFRLYLGNDINVIWEPNAEVLERIQRKKESRRRIDEINQIRMQYHQRFLMMARISENPASHLNYGRAVVRPPLLQIGNEANWNQNFPDVISHQGVAGCLQRDVSPPQQLEARAPNNQGRAIVNSNHIGNRGHWNQFDNLATQQGLESAIWNLSSLQEATEGFRNTAGYRQHNEGRAVVSSNHVGNRGGDWNQLGNSETQHVGVMVSPARSQVSEEGEGNNSFYSLYQGRAVVSSNHVGNRGGDWNQLGNSETQHVGVMVSPARSQVSEEGEGNNSFYSLYQGPERAIWNATENENIAGSRQYYEGNSSFGSDSSSGSNPLGQSMPGGLNSGINQLRHRL